MDPSQKIEIVDLADPNNSMELTFEQYSIVTTMITQCLQKMQKSEGFDAREVYPKIKKRRWLWIKK